MSAEVRIFVLDATALVALETAAPICGITFPDLLNELTTLAEDGELICPPLVIKDCKQLGETDLVTSWVRMAQASFHDASPPWDLTEEALSMCDVLFDPDDTDENAQIEVVALALQRSRAGHEVVVVTDQWVALPDGRGPLGPTFNSVKVAQAEAWDVASFILEVMP